MSKDDIRREAPVERKKRKRWPWSFLIFGLVALGAIVYLIFANTQVSAVYYMTVSELKSCTNCVEKEVRVSGFVQDGSIQTNDQSGNVHFVILETAQGQQPIMTVDYKGIVPDAFKVGAQVVVEGRYTKDGVFLAQTLLAKCPSKFEEATPGAQ